jgi:hypothetical protein
MCLMCQIKKLSLPLFVLCIALFSPACKIEHTKTVSSDAGDGRVTEHSVALKETVTHHEHGPEIYHSEKRESVDNDNDHDDND